VKMPKKLTPTEYSLRSRLLVWVLIIYVSCLSVVLILIPVIDAKLESFNETSTFYIERAKEAEATNYARLVVLELARMKDLLKVSPGPLSTSDQSIIDFVWETVTFNTSIDGIELIQGQKNAEGQHVTFRFYRQPQGEAPMPGPIKILKSFSGLEGELIQGIDQWQKVNQKLLGFINHAPKKEGEMTLRYFPVHVLMPGEGAIFWGVAKVGIDTGWSRRTLAEERRRQDQLRMIFGLYILLMLVISAILCMGLMFFSPWVRRLTEPLSKLVTVAESLDDVHQPDDYALWLENVKRFDSWGQAEVSGIQQVLLHLGNTIPKLGQRLTSGESQACLGKVMGRSLPDLQNLSVRLQTLESRRSEQGQLSEEVQKEMGVLLAQLQVKVQDLLRFWPTGTTAWQRLDLTPGIESACRLVKSRLPAKAEFTTDLQPLPMVWGSPTDLQLAVLSLLDSIVDHLDSGGRLNLKAAPSPAGGVQMVVEVLGGRLTAAAWQDWLTFWHGPGEIQEELGPALAAAIVSQHGGTLTVQPKEKDGIIFSLILPPRGTADELKQPNT
jgi:signal transduction histidine kinase